MLGSRRSFAPGVDRRHPRFPLRRRLLPLIALAALALCLFVGAARAFLPSAEHEAHEVPLPHQRGNLVYGGEAASLAGPQLSASIEQQIGGRWSVRSWNRRSGSPHYVLGSGADVATPFANGSDAESAAQSVVRQMASALRLDPDQLRVEAVTEGAGKYAVHLQQTYEGLDVIGGRAHTTFLNTGRVFVMGADFYPIQGLRVAPGISQAEAERIALDALPHPERSVSSMKGEETGLYVLPYPTSLDTFEPRLVWRVTVETAGRSGVFETYLDAGSGEILWRKNDVHYVNYTGVTEGGVQHGTLCNGEATQRLAYMKVSISGGGNTNSDVNGDWTVQNGDNTPRNATASFFGPFVDVNRSGGGDASLTSLATPGVPLTFSWTDANCRQDERDVFDAVSDIHDFFESIDPGYSYANNRITANVGVSGTCNAFWNGTINFYNAGDGCSNTGEIQGVVDHEYGHGVQDNLLGSQGDEGLGEGNGDVLANFLTDESIIARGFNAGNCVSGIRNSNNTLQYPENLTGEVHADGRIMAGVMWDARRNLEASLGPAEGELQAARIWHFGRKLERPFNQPDQCLSMFIADDDNGNVLDGTPNYDALCAAVRRHDTDADGFDCPEAGSIWVDFNYIGSEDGSESNPYNSAFEAQANAVPGYIMKVRSGASGETGTLWKPGIVRALGGLVRIGAP
jgi:Zn-dependent metalloprotease